MNKINKKMKLAEEAVELIKEFKEISSIVIENPLISIIIKDDGAIIEVEDGYDGVTEFALNEISSIFSAEMRGWGPCSAGFYEAISEAESQLEYDFLEYNKEDFIKYAGSIKYAEFRCEAIYKRLEEIEAECA